MNKLEQILLRTQIKKLRDKQAKFESLGKTEKAEEQRLQAEKLEAQFKLMEITK